MNIITKGVSNGTTGESFSCIYRIFKWLRRKGTECNNIPQIATDGPRPFFPSYRYRPAKKIDDILSATDNCIQSLITYTPTQRIFENTVRAFDYIRGWMRWLVKYAAQIMRLYPDAEMRKAASQGYIRIQAYIVENIINNRNLYRALRAYADGAGLKEN